MIERLLDLLHAGGVYRVADLARELDTTPALVEAMLENLERMGYLRRTDGGASGQWCRGTEVRKSLGGCEGCALAGACAAAGSRVWSLTGRASAIGDK